MAKTEGKERQERIEQLKKKPRQVIVRFGASEIDELEFLESHPYMAQYIKELIRADMAQNSDREN